MAKKKSRQANHPSLDGGQSNVAPDHEERARDQDLQTEFSEKIFKVGRHKKDRKEATGRTPAAGEWPDVIGSAGVIAAAPELLEACKAMADYAERKWPSFKHGNICNQLRAAIAKAEGKEAAAL